MPSVITHTHYYESAYISQPLWLLTHISCLTDYVSDNVQVGDSQVSTASGLLLMIQRAWLPMTQRAGCGDQTIAGILHVATIKKEKWKTT